MKKFLMLFLMAGAVCAQSINGVSGSTKSVDGTNLGNTTVYTLPQVQSTPGGTPTPQTSNWIALNGAQALMVEASSNTFDGSWAVQVSNNPTPVSTPGVNYYTPVRDNTDYSTTGSQTLNWAYMIKNGWRWFRFICTPATENSGTLNLQYRVYRGDTNTGVGMNVDHTYTEGVPWQTAHNNKVAGTVQSGAGTVYSEYKLPSEANGVNVYTVVAGVSGASTIATSLLEKDPVTGAVQDVADATATHAAGTNTLRVGAGYAAPYPVATPPAGQDIVSAKLSQDLVIKNVFTGSGATTFTQSIVPLR